MSERVSHSVLDPFIGPRLKALYPLLRIPRRFPPEGIVGIGHLLAIAGALGFAWMTTAWWGGLLAAAGVVGNHLADCVDGTHARRTGQCRNGGELLDHFTDPLSFAYWMVGIGVSIGHLDMALAAVICLFATAVLTNIKAKLTGQFALGKFGPTELKTLLAASGLTVTAATLAGAEGSQLVVGITIAFGMLIVIGWCLLVVNLVRGVREVNQCSTPADSSEWITTGSAKSLAAGPRTANDADSVDDVSQRLVQ